MAVTLQEELNIVAGGSVFKALLPKVLQSEIWDLRLGRDDYSMERAFPSSENIGREDIERCYKRLAEELLFAFGYDPTVREATYPLLADELKSGVQEYVAGFLNQAQGKNDNLQRLADNEEIIKQYTSTEPETILSKLKAVFKRNKKQPDIKDTYPYTVALTTLSLQMTDDLIKNPQDRKIAPLFEKVIEEVKKQLEPEQGKLWVDAEKSAVLRGVQLQPSR